jgi:hypothetical protein
MFCSVCPKQIAKLKGKVNRFSDLKPAVTLLVAFCYSACDSCDSML